LSEKSGCCINNFLIKNRSDAIAALDKICYYFENSEPNSPIPFMLRRATKIAQMNYIELVKELSPDGINQTSLILGIKEEQ
jgi:type VI secretion system protein ImpA